VSLLIFFSTKLIEGWECGSKLIVDKGGIRIGKKPKTKIAFDVLNAKELMQKL
jgi:hypothetical protein